MTPANLSSLFSFEAGHEEALDLFISTCLFEAGLWGSPRTSDGIVGVDRVLVHEPERLRITGRISTIQQSIHQFWLELDADPVTPQVGWFLYFDVLAASARSARNAFDSIERAEDTEWRARLAGEAEVRDGALMVVPGSTRVLVQDMPEPQAGKPRRRRDE